jgi:SAM-dependent methyltransferase
LGPVCGDSVVFLASQGVRVTVDAFEPPPLHDPDAQKAPAPIRIPFADDKFDLILAWEWVDFVPKERLPDLAAEIHRLLRPGGQLLIFSLNHSQGAGREAPPRYRVVDVDRVIRESSGGRARRRYVHPTRALEDSLAPLSIQGVQLQRNQMREILASRKALPRRQAAATP